MQTQNHTEDRLANARSQAFAQLESIKEMVAELLAAEESGDDEAREAAEQRIQEDALSVEVRGGWYSPGGDGDSGTPSEFKILLCTGGPAVRIIGGLNDYSEPSTLCEIRLEFQDWFTPWTPATLGIEDREALVAYARCFYFGE